MIKVLKDNTIYWGLWTVWIKNRREKRYLIDMIKLLNDYLMNLRLNLNQAVYSIDIYIRDSQTKRWIGEKYKKSRDGFKNA